MILKHPRLAHAIMALRPGARPTIDFKVQDAGDGPFLVKDSMENPPAQSEVDAVSVEQLDKAQSTRGQIEHKQPELAINALAKRIGLSDEEIKKLWEMAN